MLIQGVFFGVLQVHVSLNLCNTDLHSFLKNETTDHNWEAS